MKAAGGAATAEVLGGEGATVADVVAVGATVFVFAGGAGASHPLFLRRFG